MKNQLKQKRKIQYNRRIAQLSPVSQITNFEDWRNSIGNNFPELLPATIICASVMSQLLIKDVHNPFGLILIDAPSSGKTIILNFFMGLTDLTYTTDKFTPKAFVSHAMNKKKEELNNIDLLPKIQYKTMICPELGTLFSKRYEDLNETMGLLTRLFDGEGLSIDSGAHGSRSYKGDYLFMFLGASTPIRKSVWKIMSTLGARLFFLNINSKYKTKNELISQIQGNNFKTKINFCKDITKNFFTTLWSQNNNGIHWNQSKDDISALSVIATYAIFLAKSRSNITVFDNYESNKHSKDKQAIPERPDRINQLLYNLTRGHAVLHNRNFITIEDTSILRNICLSSIPQYRKEILKVLFKYNNQTIEQLIDKVSFSKNTLREVLNDLIVLGVISYEKSNINGIKAYNIYNINPEFNEIYQNNELENF